MTARATYTNTTGVGPFSFENVDLFSNNIIPYQTQLKVLVNGSERTYVPSGPGTGEYTINAVAKEVTLGLPLGVDDTLTIKRETQTTSYIDFTNNAPLTADDLDITAQQSLFLAEEGLDAISVGDVNVALPQLTDVNSNLLPVNGQFLRYDEASGKWTAQAFSPDGLGPDVNIVTQFPSSAQDGEIVYHTTYGAAYVYIGGSWKNIGAAGYTDPVGDGVTVAELTWPSVSPTVITTLDTLATTNSIPEGWHIFVQDTGLIEDNNLAPYVSWYHPSTRDTWIDITASNQRANQTAGENEWQKLWVVSPVGKDAEGRFTCNQLVLEEGQNTNTVNLETLNEDRPIGIGGTNNGWRLIGSNTGNDPAYWYSGAFEDNHALQAESVLLPRFTATGGEYALCEGVEDVITQNGTYLKAYRRLLLGTTANIDWETQSWRITINLVTFGIIANPCGSMMFTPKYSSFLTKGDEDNGWSFDGNNYIPTNGGLTTGDLQAALGLQQFIMFEDASSTTSTVVPIGVPESVSTTNTTQIAESLFRVTSSPFAENNVNLPSSATIFKPTGSGGNSEDTINAVEMTITWDAAAKVLTIQTGMDAVSQAVIDTATNSETYTWQSDPSQGPVIGQWLSQQSSEVFFCFGQASTGSSDTGYDTTWASNSWIYTPLPGISGIKIETLDIP